MSRNWSNNSMENERNRFVSMTKKLAQVETSTDIIQVHTSQNIPSNKPECLVYVTM